MRVLAVVIGALGTVISLAAGGTSVGVTRSDPPLLIPGSAQLMAGHIQARCDSVWYLVRDSAGASAERVLLPRQVRESITIYRGKSAVLVTTAMTAAGTLHTDSALFYRDGLAPISETSWDGAQGRRYDFDGDQVRIRDLGPGTSDSVTVHQYPAPVFNFAQLDALLRSLPFRPGFEALVPLYSEGDDALEIDTVRVDRVDERGVWHLRFADPAIVASIEIDSTSRLQVGYAHQFRTNGPIWKTGNVWRLQTGACGS